MKAARQECHLDADQRGMSGGGRIPSDQMYYYRWKNISISHPKNFPATNTCMKLADRFLLSERSDFINHTDRDGAGGRAAASCPESGQTELQPQQ